MPISDLRTIPKKLTPKGGRYRRAQPPSMAGCADVQPLAVAGAAFDAGCQWPWRSPSVGVRWPVRRRAARQPSKVARCTAQPTAKGAA